MRSCQGRFSTTYLPSRSFTSGQTLRICHAFSHASFAAAAGAGAGKNSMSTGISARNMLTLRLVFASLFFRNLVISIFRTNRVTQLLPLLLQTRGPCKIFQHGSYRVPLLMAPLSELMGAMSVLRCAC